MATISVCPCGGGNYAACCGPFHAGLAAPDAERTMRSRYSAYVLRLESYLLATWHADTRPTSLDLLADNEKWLGLEIKKHLALSDELASVEFVARYKINGRAHRLHEISRFLRVDGQWFYVDGEFPRRAPHGK